MPTKKAFSLIEIIIFIAVLSILMTTLLQSVALNLSADTHQSQELILQKVTICDKINFQCVYFSNIQEILYPYEVNATK